MDMAHIEYFFLGMAGALSLEILKLYEYHHRLTESRFRKLVCSSLFWVVFLGMLVASGFIAWAVNVDAKRTTVWGVVLTGMGARAIVRELGSAQRARSTAKLGGTEDEPITWKDVFG